MKIFKVLPIIAFFLLIISLGVMINNYSVFGYEISPYDQYPWYLWWFIILSIFISQLLLISKALFRDDLPIHPISGICCIFLSNLTLLFLPLIRRYPIYGFGDPSTHLGYMIRLLQVGNFGKDMYPMDHILGAISYLITGIDLKILMELIPPIFYLLFALSIFLSLRVVFEDSSEILIGMSLAIILITGFANIWFTPNDQANSIFPFVIYLFYSRFSGKNTSQYGILFVIFTIVLCFFHPLVCLLAISFLIFNGCGHFILKHLSIDTYKNYKTSLPLIIINLAIFFTWGYYLRIFMYDVGRIFDWIGGIYQQSIFNQYSGLIAQTRPSYIYLLKHFILSYGEIFIMTFLALISVMVILYFLFKERSSVKLFQISFSMAFVFAITFYIISNFILVGTGFVRFGTWSELFCLFLIPPVILSLIRRGIKGHFKKLFLIFYVLMLFSLDIITLFAVFWSPLTLTYGQDVPNSYLDSMETFFRIDYHNIPIPIMEFLSTHNRTADALYGITDPLRIYSMNTIPDHFGYGNVKYSGYFLYHPRYLILSSLGRNYYEKAFPEFKEKWKFNQYDFAHLEKDINVDKFYTSKEIDIYLSYPTRSWDKWID